MPHLLRHPVFTRHRNKCGVTNRKLPLPEQLFLIHFVAAISNESIIYKLLL